MKKIKHNRHTKPDCSEEFWNSLSENQKIEYQREGIHVLSKDCWCQPKVISYTDK